MPPFFGWAAPIYPPQRQNTLLSTEGLHSGGAPHCHPPPRLPMKPGSAASSLYFNWHTVPAIVLHVAGRLVGLRRAEQLADHVQRHVDACRDAG